MGDKDEEKKHTDSDIRLVDTLARIDVRQEMLTREFSDHKKEDSRDFGKITDAIKDVQAEISKVPENLTDCGARIKEEIMEESKSRFVSDTDFKVFVTEVKTGTTMAVSIMSAVIIIANIIISYFVGK